MRTGDELSAVHWFEAEDASIQQAVAWALDHDPDVALRLTVAVASWWQMRGTGDAAREVLLSAAGQAAHGTRQWCLAQFWLGDIGPPAASLIHETAALEILTDQPPTPLLAELMAGRSRTLLFFGRVQEAVSDARRALDVACQIGYPAGEVLALATLSRAARSRGDATAALDWARQAQRILASGELGWTAQFTGGSFFFEVLAESGDLIAARHGLENSLAWARETGNLITQASVLRLMAEVELRAGNFAGSGRHLREATEITARVDPTRLIICLDLAACLCAARDQWAEAVTIWTAFQAGLEAEGLADLPMNAERRQDLLRRADQVLGPGHTRTASERGAAMSLQAATEFALLLVPPSPESEPARPPTGLTQLSSRERELVSLVAKGCTDAQIAGQLYISVSTVRSHLDRIRDKTGSRRRADLTRMALQAGLV
jgi:DNA-binding CsgD family transcriptional regulator